jgi:uncharacterized protein (TIGR00369 family)
MSSANRREVERLFCAAPFIADLGIRLVSLGYGECRSSLELAPRHLQQDGYVHAGVQASIADHTAGAAAASMVGDGQYILSVEFKINMLRAARGATLDCVARVIKPGRSLIVVESDVWCRGDNGESLVSRAMLTMAVRDHEVPR